MLLNIIFGKGTRQIPSRIGKKNQQIQAELSWLQMKSATK